MKFRQIPKERQWTSNCEKNLFKFLLSLVACDNYKIDNKINKVIIEIILSQVVKNKNDFWLFLFFEILFLG